MIKENQKLLNSINIVTDGLIIFVSILLAYVVRFVLFEGASGHLVIQVYIRYSVVIIPVYLFIYAAFDLYGSFRSKGFLYEVSLLVRANLLGFLLFMTVLFIFKAIDVSRWTLVFFMMINVFCACAKRVFLRLMLRRFRRRGFNQKHVLVIGSGPSALNYIHAVLTNGQLGFRVSGYVSEKAKKSDLRVDGQSIECLCTVSGLEDFLSNSIFDEVVCALDTTFVDLLPQVIRAAEKGGQRLCVIPFYYDILPSRPYMDDIGGVPLMNIRHIPLDNFLNAFLKRLADILGSLFLIVLTSPVMLVTAVVIRLSSPGPVIFKQVRVGRDKKHFTMYKFRSMKVNSSENSGWSTDTDSRRTRFGSFIRKFSIDELPQFFNVLDGSMSLVGPRPELPVFVEQFRESVPLYMIKHQVRPGITGWSQVHGLRGDTSIEERIRHDLYYIENWSFMLDIRIILLTICGGLVNSEHLR